MGFLRLGTLLTALEESQLSVAEKDGCEFLTMYHKACKVYKSEGEQDELGKLNVKVYRFRCSSSK